MSKLTNKTMTAKKKKWCIFSADVDYQDSSICLCKGDKFSLGESVFEIAGFSRLSGEPMFSVLQPGKELVDFLHKTEPVVEFDGDRGSIRLKNPEFVDVLDTSGEVHEMYKSSI